MTQRAEGRPQVDSPPFAREEGQPDVPGRGRGTRFEELPPEGRDGVDKVVEHVLSTGVPALISLSEDLRNGGGAATPEEVAVLQELYPGLEKLVHALYRGLFLRPLWKSPQEINKLIKELDAAEETFGRVGHARLANLSKALRTWGAAFLELQDLNTTNFDVQRRRAMTFLQDAGDYRAVVGEGTMSLEPFLFMMAGEKAQDRRDSKMSAALMEQGAQAAAEMTDLLAEAEMNDRLTPAQLENLQRLRTTYQGMVRLYGAITTFARAREWFDKFDFDALADEDLVADAREALHLMEQGLQKGDFRTLTHYSRALYHLLESTNRFARLIQQVFHSVYTGSPVALRNLKHEIREARKAVLQAGLEFKSLVDYCDTLSTQVDNLERLASPSGKDFGKFSGLVAAGIFLPTVLVLSWANGQFGLNIGATAILEYSLLVGLVAGFGLAALKFTPKGLFKTSFLKSLVGGGGKEQAPEER